MNRPQPSAEPALPLTSASKHATPPEALRACHQTKDAAVRHMHGVYERLCGVPVRLRMDHMLTWNQWLRAGYSERDLRTVMSYLKEEIDHGRRNIGSLKLNNLLNVPRFEDDLQLVRMQRRGLRRSAVSHPPAATPTVSPEVENQAHERGLLLMREWKQRNRHLRRD